MTNIRLMIFPITRISKPLTYKQIKRNKGDVKRFIENQKESRRATSRTPFQWDSSSTGDLQQVLRGWKSIELNTMWKCRRRILIGFKLFKKMIKCEKPIRLLYGHYHLLDKEYKQVYAIHGHWVMRVPDPFEFFKRKH
jgi:hypothetical protein